jgi:hypothetical protein
MSFGPWSLHSPQYGSSTKVHRPQAPACDDAAANAHPRAREVIALGLNVETGSSFP